MRVLQCPGSLAKEWARPFQKFQWTSSLEAGMQYAEEQEVDKGDTLLFQQQGCRERTKHSSHCRVGGTPGVIGGFMTEHSSNHEAGRDTTRSQEGSQQSTAITAWGGTQRVTGGFTTEHSSNWGGGLHDKGSQEGSRCL